jgi:hypothetical protein
MTPGIVVADRVVVHQEDVLGHFDLPILLRLRSKHCRLALGLDIQRILADNGSSKLIVSPMAQGLLDGPTFAGHDNETGWRDP